MRALFELSREHPTLPFAEVVSCLNAERVKFKIIDYGNYFLEVSIEENNIKNVIPRLSMCFYVNHLLFSSYPDVKRFLSKALEKKIHLKGTFRVRCKDCRKEKEGFRSVDIERELGGIYARYGRVDLEEPDDEIRVLLTDGKWFVGKMIAKIDRSSFEGRKAHNRPFFSPISMHPRLARAMVNLSLARKGDKILDPFCGTGGILIEAGLIGLKPLGSDVKKKMAEGSKLNLKFFNVEDFEIIPCDIGEIPYLFGKVDAIVTDFPYGKATSTNKESISSLYPRAFEAIADTLKQGGRAVLALPSIDAVEQCSEVMKPIEVHKYMVHKSLTRYISVYIKS